MGESVDTVQAVLTRDLGADTDSPHPTPNPQLFVCFFIVEFTTKCEWIIHAHRVSLLEIFTAQLTLLSYFSEVEE